MKARTWLAETALYLVALALTCAVLGAAFRLRGVDLNTPLAWSGDVLYTQIFILNYLDTGNAHLSTQTGAPFGTDLHDFPVAETVHLTIFRALSLISRDPCWLVNVFYFVGFPLTTLTSLLTLRALGIGRLASLICGLLYTFTPAHYFRFGHLFLASFYLVPLMILVIVWACRNQFAVGERRQRITRWACAIVIGLLMSGGGVYYAFFGCFFLLVAGVACAARERQYRGALPAVALICVVTAGLLAQITPSLLYQAENGKNPDVAVRQPFESDIFGLRPIYMLLPIHNHQISRMSRITHTYMATSPFGSGESGISALGLAGALGVVGLIAYFLFAPGRSADSLLHILGLLLVAGLLLATVTGFAYFFAYYISPKIRCYNRISIYLGFFAIAAVAIVLDQLFRFAASRGKLSAACAGGFGLLLLACGILDQTPRPYFRFKSFTVDVAAPVREFASRIEQSLPPDALVLQLPIVSFPEAAPLEQMGCYDHFRPAMFARGLRWSHGVVRGRYADSVLSTLGRMPIEQLIDCAAHMGFSGIHLDRFGYKDNGAEIEARLAQLLQVTPTECANGRDRYYDLRAWRDRTRRGQPESSWRELELNALNPTEVSLWCGSATFIPSDPDRKRLFPLGSGEVELYNPLDAPRSVTLRFDVAAPGAAAVELRLSGDILDKVRAIAPTYREQKHSIVVPPGKHRIIFTCLRDGRPAYFEIAKFDVINLPLAATDGVVRRAPNRRENAQ